MNPIQKWFATYNISSHTISAGIVGFVTLYLSVPALKDLVDGLLAGHKTLSALFAAALGIALKYSGSHSTQGQAQQLIATAQTNPKQVQEAVAIANASSPVTAPVVTVVAK
jgi:hypothetical protein